MGCDQDVECLYSKSMFCYQFNRICVSKYSIFNISTLAAKINPRRWHVSIFSENGEYYVYSPQIETQYCHCIKTSLVAKDLVF